MPESADPPSHELPRVLGERLRGGSRPGRRTDGLRIALAIEGGGMRGTISAGMALALHELGLMPAFDAVYGASAGAITAAWLISSRPEGLRGWAEPTYAKTLIRKSGPLRGRPVVDVRTLIEVVYQTQWPMDFASVLASAVEYHPLATDAGTGASTDLRPLIGDPAELRLALRASASLPFLAGPPVQLRGRRFYDAGLSESIPFRTPLAQGATHTLVLRSRRVLPNQTVAAPAGAAGRAAADPAGADRGAARPAGPAGVTGADHGARPAGVTGADHGAAGPAGVTSADRASAANPAGLTAAIPDDAAVLDAALRLADADPDGAPGQRRGAPAPRPSREVRLLARTALRKESPELRTALLTRSARTAADVALIAELEAAGRAFSIRPPVSGPSVSRLTTDGALLAAAFEVGRRTLYEAFGMRP